jgi:glutamate formiminotransferase
VVTLLECVPNFSEGRRLDVVGEIVGAIAAVPGIAVLDHSADESHNRSVVTFAGPVEAVDAAAEQAVRVAVDRIDMRRHTGVHPRIGAVDVMPFVPLATTSIADAVAVARGFAERIASQFGLPTYLYGEAALRPDRVRLADIRRGGYEALVSLVAEASRAPDFGPASLHPTAGAMAVGARQPLIAFNVNLRTDDVRVARRIAVAVRESSGGMPGVQAIGVLLENAGSAPAAQVSTNLLDWRMTGIGALVAEVRRLASAAGTDIEGCELIGLVPAAAIDGLDGAALGIPGLADRTIEGRLGPATLE